MICLDTNIFVYISKRQLDISLIATQDCAYSTIVKIESLGYSNITVREQALLTGLFAEYEHLWITTDIIERTIILRQMKKIGLGDAIIAATAIENDCELWTANEADFAGIDGLKLYNPLRSGTGRHITP